MSLSAARDNGWKWRACFLKSHPIEPRTSSAVGLEDRVGPVDSHRRRTVVMAAVRIAQGTAVHRAVATVVVVAGLWFDRLFETPTAVNVSSLVQQSITRNSGSTRTVGLVTSLAAASSIVSWSASEAGSRISCSRSIRRAGTTAIRITARSGG
jgi:hypothetical protein